MLEATDTMVPLLAPLRKSQSELKRWAQPHGLPTLRD
jgi:hypothetical protein